MKKSFLILSVAFGIILSSGLRSFAFDCIKESDLTNKGYSKYFVSLANLQINRQQNQTNYTVPDPGKTFLKNIFVGDFNLPTQDFGFYEIYNRDFIEN